MQAGYQTCAGQYGRKFREYLPDSSLFLGRTALTPRHDSSRGCFFLSFFSHRELREPAISRCTRRITNGSPITFSHCNKHTASSCVRARAQQPPFARRRNEIADRIGILRETSRTRLGSVFFENARDEFSPCRKS